MPLIHLENISLSFGEAALLDKIHLKIEPRERTFLIGRNGMGKSTLLQVILGAVQADQGKIHRNPGLKIAELSQNLPEGGDTTVYDMVAEGLQEVGILLKQYHHLTGMSADRIQEMTEATWLKELEDVQKKLEDKHGWQYQQIIDTILTRLDLPADKKMDTLSGGWKRRVALARALVCQPDLLLLDEPTNHLDLAAIEWLEEYLAQYPGAVICITHDRTLLRKLSQRILELDRGQLTSWTGNYDKFLIDKEHRLEVEVAQAKLFDKNLAKEETWIRQGIKARRTRNEGRVRALKKLREERKLRREKQGKPKFAANETQLSGDLVVNAENVSYHIQNNYLVKDFSIRVYRGDKIALVGANGIGKSTLLKILLGHLSPTEGKVVLGTQLQIGYFDQLRSGIKPELSVVENVAGGRETISINGAEKHIISYLADFLFTPARARTPVKKLSGGECNRLLLAKLFSLPSNLLVLDEPTNDLDIESLELLEEILADYKGTLLLVSHDRTFVEQVATSTLYFSGNGKIDEYIGGCQALPSAMNTQKSDVTSKLEIPKNNENSQNSQNTQTVESGEKNKNTSLNSNIQFNSRMKKELDGLPEKIAKLEAEQLKLQVEIADNDFYNKEKSYIATTLASLKKIDDDLAKLYKRWEDLEELKNK